MLVWTWNPDCSNLALLWHTGWLSLVEGDRGVRARRKGGWEVYRRREKRGGGKGHSQGEVGEIGKIMQHCAKFCNQNSAKGWEPTNTEWELG